ncbi:MAG: hypothetical protein ACLP0J_08330 [Solirubrobacteraceae bacterium]
MLVEGSSDDLEVAETVGFELIGPDFRYAGLAAVAHREHEAIGLRFVTARGPVDRSVRALAATRLSSGQLRSHDPPTAATRIPTVMGFSEVPRSPHQQATGCLHPGLVLTVSRCQE